MTTSVLERPSEVTTQEEILTEENKKELCKKLCLNIFEGLLEGYEELKEKNPEEAESLETKISEIKYEIERQKVYNIQ